jgi:hypothetical protein
MPNRFQPGQRSSYGGVLVERPKDDPLRTIAAPVCGRCQGYGRVGEELWCAACKGGNPDLHDDLMVRRGEVRPYEPYYETNAGFSRSGLGQNRTFTDMGSVPRQRASSGSMAGVRRVVAGRTRKK